MSNFISQTSLPTNTPDVLIPDVPCEASALVGHWVRLSSGTAIRALADDVTNSAVIGVIEEKPTATTANIRVAGVSAEIFSGLVEGSDYFLSDSVVGEMSLSVPIGANKIVLNLGRPFSASRLIVKIHQRIKRA